MYVCMYIISVVVLQIHVYQSCAQIDNNQQVYEAQIQVPRCNSNSILKAGSHEYQKLMPLHLDRCTGEHTDHSPKAIVFRLGKILLLDRCFHPSPNISSSIILIYTLFYYYYHNFYFYTFKGCIHQITTKLLIHRFHICIKKGITTPLLFLLFCLKLETNLDNEFRDLLLK
jgi:hypothetical protein